VTVPGAGDDAEPDRRHNRITSLWRRHRARWALPLVIIVIIGAVAVVDHVGANRISQVDTPTTPALVAAQGGTAAAELDTRWDGFNPNTPAGADSSTTTLLTSVLPSAYVTNEKLIPEVNTALLQSVEVISTSPLTIQYVINPKARWSDGVPVTAADFIYAWDSQRGSGIDVDGQPDQVASTLGYRDVDSVKPSKGGKTVTVRFATPYTDWRDLFDHMVPAHIAELVGWNSGFDSFNPAVDLSAGPYILKSVSASGSAVLVRNPHFWGTPAVLSRIDVSVHTDPTGWTDVLADGNHVVAQPSGFDLAALNSVTSLPNTQSVVKPSLDLLQLEFDVTSPLGQHAAGRQAIAHAIDRNALLTHTFGSIDPDLVVNQDHLATTALSSYTASSAAGEYATPDLQATDRLLRSIGYHQGADGIYEDADGHPLVLRMAVESGDPWIGEVADQIVDQLRVAGIEVDPFTVDGPAGMSAAADADSYDMALVTRVTSPYLTTTAAWYSDGQGTVGSGGTEDWSKFDDPQVDQLFAQAAQALDPVAGGAVYGQIDDQLWDQMVALPLFGEPGLLANGVQVTGQEYNPSADGILWNASQWTLLKPGPTSDR
jgi:peptide/nickel transport system substrate-binding protein